MRWVRCWCLPFGSGVDVVDAHSGFILACIKNLMANVVLAFVTLILVTTCRAGASSRSRSVIVFSAPRRRLGIGDFRVFRILPSKGTLTEVGSCSRREAVMLFLTGRSYSSCSSRGVRIPCKGRMVRVNSCECVAGRRFMGAIPVVSFLSGRRWFLFTLVRL